MIENILHRIHYIFLYVLMYSIVRLLLWPIALSETQETVLGFLAIGFFLWFVGVNIFLHFRKSKAKTNHKEYRSPYVVTIALSAIILLELLAYWKRKHGTWESKAYVSSLVSTGFFVLNFKMIGLTFNNRCFLSVCMQLLLPWVHLLFCHHS